MEIKQYEPGMELKGFISGMPNEVYHAQKQFISNSGLSLIAQSPAHYAESPIKETAAMSLGTAFHAAILEPEVYKQRYCLMPACPDRRQAAFKEAAKEFGANNVLLGKDIDLIEGMRVGLNKDPDIVHLINQISHTEVSLFTQCPNTGVKVRVRYDALTKCGYAVDLKSTRDASEDGFQKSIFDFRYHVQAALYMDAYEWETGERLNGFIIPAVENTLPHNAMPYEIDDTSLAIGRHEYQKGLAVFADCTASGIWPGYKKTRKGANLTGIPEWAVMRFENETGLDTVMTE